MKSSVMGVTGKTQLPHEAELRKVSKHPSHPSHIHQKPRKHADVSTSYRMEHQA